ncbi:DUF4303 domain-containing protein [Brevundimonas vitis]|uniref:DUF4303 domain-containing protein n=1 Tax=Brevundimonas vitisensis TaxID=2800818 RepID=A0ABX7BMK6_9CAUL|nr:DUF4303 domain-containing protein [Brevundimonas vitisensis]QQQ18501.1 DUF4303 domain-containing protein [Brevundimonas vitisensis]
MHKMDDDTPSEFYEVRQFRSQIWVAEGAVKTFGMSHTINASSSKAARQEIDRLLAKKGGAGFVKSAEGCYRRGSFDFGELKGAVKSASRASFDLIRAKHADHKLYGFGITTDEVPMTLGAMAQTVKAIAAETDEALRSEAEWNLQAWPIEEGDGFFDIPYRLLLRQSRGDIPFEQTIADDEFANGAFEAFVSALEELRNEGVLADAQGDAIVLMVQPSDFVPIEGMIERLNADPAVVQRYYAENG